MNRLLACALLGSVVALAACSDDDDASGNSTADATTVASPTGDTTTDDTAAAGTSTDDTMAGGSTGPSSGSPGDDFCQLDDRLDAIASLRGQFRGPDKLRAALAGIGDTIDEAIAQAPDEIATDVEMLGGAYHEIVTAVEGVDYDYLEMPIAPLAALDEDQRIREAKQRVDDYVDEHCGPDEDDVEYDESPFAGLPDDATIRDAFVAEVVERGAPPESADCVSESLEAELIESENRDRLNDLIIGCGVDPDTGEPLDETPATS